MASVLPKCFPTEEQVNTDQTFFSLAFTHPVFLTLPWKNHLTGTAPGLAKNAYSWALPQNQHLGKQALGISAVSYCRGGFQERASWKATTQRNWNVLPCMKDIILFSHQIAHFFSPSHLPMTLKSGQGELVPREGQSQLRH